MRFIRPCCGRLRAEVVPIPHDGAVFSAPPVVAPIMPMSAKRQAAKPLAPISPITVPFRCLPQSITEKQTPRHVRIPHVDGLNC